MDWDAYENERDEVERVWLYDLIARKQTENNELELKIKHRIAELERAAERTRETTAAAVAAAAAAARAGGSFFKASIVNQLF
jgi:hypothetical protein